jgi:aminomethyltransferase
LAIQGPKALEICEKLFKEHNLLHNFYAPDMAEWNKLKPFRSVHLINSDEVEVQVARTGYTGEDGIEIMLTDICANNLWQALIKEGVQPCGLGARDTLRLEAGLRLYGQDMNEETLAYQAGLNWVVDADKSDFMGKDATLHSMFHGENQKMVGLKNMHKGIMRNGQKITHPGVPNEEGIVTSGGFSPTLNTSIALARVPKDFKGEVIVHNKDKKIPVNIVPLPFYKK